MPWGPLDGIARLLSWLPGGGAEAALREREERLRLAQDAARMGTFEWYPDTGEVHWSPEIERLYGLPVGAFERSETAWEDQGHPQDRKRGLRRVKHGVARGERFDVEFRVVWPDGMVRWLAS